ncbi:MAG: flagellar protein FlgN [Magnetospirillum sp.]|nr:flagellar protein FlgN [Magnetospirillum sp.]
MTAGTEVAYEDLIWVCTNLCELIEVENAALARHDSAAVRELAENKAALAQFYEQLVAPIAANPGLAEGLEPDRKEELAAIGNRLAELMVVNTTLLTAEIGACQRLMDALAAATRSQNGAVNYSPGGTLESRCGERSSLALDKTL